jgi:DNA-binding CsgD family transcriptional regulator
MAIKLTKTEQQIYENAMFGYSIKQLANMHEISESQIKWHLGNIYKKRNVANRTELMAKEIFGLLNRIRELEND